MARKFIYYLKGYSRTIVITDKDDSRPIEETVDKISRVMSGCKVSKFETDNDILIVRPSDIIGVHIEKETSKHEEDKKIKEPINLQSIVPEIDLDDIESNVEENCNIKIEDSFDNYEIEEDFENGSTGESDDDNTESD